MAVAQSVQVGPQWVDALATHAGVHVAIPAPQPHVPALHVWPVGDNIVQSVQLLPQCDESCAWHTPPVHVTMEPHEHAPLTHVAPRAVQLVQPVPQCPLSCVTHVDPQSTIPVLHVVIMQVEFEHVCAAVHVVPHAPQLLVSVAVLTH